MKYPKKIGRQYVQTGVPGMKIDRLFNARLTVDGELIPAMNTNGVIDAEPLTEDAKELTEGIVSPAYPRALRVVGSEAGIAGNVIITGKNISGEAITETIVASGTNIVNGAKAFAVVTKIELPGWDADGDKISVGFNNRLGLPYKLKQNTVIKGYLDNTASNVTVVVDGSDFEKNTVLLDAALNGKDVTIDLLV